MEISVKTLSWKDARTAKELFLWFQEDDEAENPTSASDEYLTKLLHRDDFHVIVSLKDNKVVGGLVAYELAGYKDEEAEMYLFEMGVDEAYQRQGIGTALIETLKEICREKGIEEMFVEAFADNTPAIKLYQKMGGKGVKVVEFTYELD